MTAYRLAACVIASVLATAAAVAQTTPQVDLYRGEPYNAPVPDALKGAQVIDADRAIAMDAEGVPFLDVFPRKRKPEGLPEGTIWREPRHDTIPGAVWLWDTGYQRQSDAEKARLENGLRAATGGDLDAPVVIFCRADCWMSWNAAKRAVAWGYTGVYWFPGGTDGWQQAGGADLVKAEPVDP
ncbi:PQQ-dependent catabolism-associated CXXCW motif protein [Paracoccus sp. M683]|uniref:rhodanese-like domain-containing protein n=1 Tax=Paracoccus sp. M683 TaxID=2594268 RepID=UPI00118007AC|nr:rhodanese-like domain-containing protein [Paracoccus sp. M683]TRW98766.1 PQQ-dependent catabolism-associated CXXCW motif protein [Paracoccus sp. M683]